MDLITVFTLWVQLFGTIHVSEIFETINAIKWTGTWPKRCTFLIKSCTYFNDSTTFFSFRILGIFGRLSIPLPYIKRFRTRPNVHPGNTAAGNAWRVVGVLGTFVHPSHWKWKEKEVGVSLSCLSRPSFFHMGRCGALYIKKVRRDSLQNTLEVYPKQIRFLSVFLGVRLMGPPSDAPTSFPLFPLRSCRAMKPSWRNQQVGWGYSDVKQSAFWTDLLPYRGPRTSESAVKANRVKHKSTQARTIFIARPHFLHFPFFLDCIAINSFAVLLLCPINHWQNVHEDLTYIIFYT